MNDGMQERVDRGVQFLDAVVPDWRDLIDLKHLDFSDPAFCVLGQVFRDPDSYYGSGWAFGSTELEIFEEEAQLLDGDPYDDNRIEYGFDVEHGDITYADLQNEWLARIL